MHSSINSKTITSTTLPTERPLSVSLWTMLASLNLQHQTKKVTRQILLLRLIERILASALLIAKVASKSSILIKVS